MRVRNNRTPYLRRLFLAFVIATIVFILIFSVAYSVSYLNYKGITTENNIILDALNRLDHVLEGESCDDLLLFQSSESLDLVGSKLSLLEKRFGVNDPRVLEQKKLYTDLEMKHFLIIKGFNENCGRDFLPIFFFYSNAQNKQDDSELISSILSSFKRSHSSRVMVYSFDSNLDHEGISKLKERHGLIEVPVVVVNESEVVYIRNIRDLEVFL